MSGSQVVREAPEPDGAQSSCVDGREAVLSAYADFVNPTQVQMLRAAGLDVVEAARDGVYVTDLDGRRWLDCFTSSGAFNVGRRNPAVVAALLRALEEERLDLGDTAFVSAPRADLARRLAEITPGDLEGVTFATGGGEAVDFAIKLARGATGRPGIVSTAGAYHGHTGFALSAAGNEAYRAPFAPLVPGFTRIPFGDLSAADAAVDGTTAAVIVEPVQGEGGVNIPPPGYLAGLRRLCDERGAQLITDEIQTGLGRTGRLFACDHWDVVPDVMTLGKSLGGGLYPISATVYRRHLQEWVRRNPFVHFSTFGGADLGCRVALAAVEYIIENDLAGHATRMGERLARGLGELRERHPGLLVDVRQIGLMAGLEFEDESLGPRMSMHMLRNGVLAMPTGDRLSVLRIMPALVIRPAQIDELLVALQRSMASL